jgi:hypothetical protein
VFFVFFREECNMSKSKTGRGSNRRRLWAEQLEPRTMLAGNVTASVRGGTLFVRGDSNDNQVGIVQLDSDTYAVVGVAGTSVNGQVDGIFVTDRPVVHITADLGAGDDLLGVGNDPQAIVDTQFDFSFDFTAALGDPDAVAAAVQAELDAVGAPDTFALPGNLIIRMGNGIDGVAVIGDIGRSVIVDLGNGSNNGFSLDSFSSVGGSLVVTGRGGADEVVVQDSDIGGSMTLSLSSGDDLVLVQNTAIGGSAVVNTGNGIDDIEINDTDIRLALVINSGAGDDDIHADDATGGDGVVAGGAVVINSGTGHDHVQFSGQARALTILTGGGSDGVDIFDSLILGSLVVNTGADADAISINEITSGRLGGVVEVRGSAVLDAGTGNDNNSIDTLDASFQSAGVSIFDLDVGLSLIVRLGSGNDSFEADFVSVGLTALLDAGAGNDTAVISNAAVDLLFTALMGSGNDLLEITSSTAPKIGLHGGPGTDEFVSDIDPDNPPPGVQILFFLSFEIVVVV